MEGRRLSTSKATNDLGVCSLRSRAIAARVPTEGAPRMDAEQQDFTDADHDDEDVHDAVLRHAFSLWIGPELERRGLPVDLASMRAALVTLSRDGATVLLNEEAGVIAKVKARGPINKGDPVTEEQIEAIEEIYPASIDPDTGWICVARVGVALVVAFDFGRNRERARRLVALGDEFVATAAEAHAARRLGPATENAHAAAELAVKAEMYLSHDTPTRQHAKRQKYWHEWADLGNVPRSHADALSVLGAHRAAARYGDGSLDLSDDDVEQLIVVARDMLTHARQRVGEPLPDHSDDLAMLELGPDHAGDDGFRLRSHVVENENSRGPMGSERPKAPRGSGAPGQDQ